ncbi:TRAP transporter small permease [Pseudoruegeria sp. HB172150]|uniref:TRAP transporter small permease n=1 Tax=Pseudoruegeria sp. HB172150 TaxID=2721164 RepID=UPI0015534D62|nr:TRAP transporter small permease [Pseudoruegeria sp. HB172150]
MQQMIRVRDALLSALAVLGAIAIVALMVHVVADVAMRNLANSPIPATYEIVTEYYMIALAFIPLAWVERRGGMVQVEVLEGLLGPNGKKVSDWIVALLSTIIYGTLCWVTLRTALQNFNTGTFVMSQSTRLVVWPASFLLPIGFALAALVTAIRLILPEEPK